MRTLWDRWGQAVSLLGAAVVVALTAGSGRFGWLGLLLASGLAVAALWMSPLRPGRHVPNARAVAAAGPDDVVVYWRPGCPFCMRLTKGLGPRADEVTWVNVYRDVEAEQRVRSLNDGNLLVPTVLTGDGRRLDLTADAVLAHLDRLDRPDHQDRRTR